MVKRHVNKGLLFHGTQLGWLGIFHQNYNEPGMFTTELKSTEPFSV